MTDVLSLCIPIPGRYPSVNSLGRDGLRFGRKSEEYRALFKAVKEAAEAEMARTGWITATCECLSVIVRYIGDRRRTDAANLAKCEWDALTAAGVWSDDRLANPCHFAIRRDPNGEHRVSIVVVKLHQSINAEEVMPNATVSKLHKRDKPLRRSRPDVTPPRVGARRKVTEADLQTWRPGDPIPPGYALFGGKLVATEFVLDLIKQKGA